MPIVARPKHADPMKRLTPIAAVAVSWLLLAGCQSKRDICAHYAAHAPNVTDEQLADYWKGLGIEHPMPEGLDADERMLAVDDYCKKSDQS